MIKDISFKRDLERKRSINSGKKKLKVFCTYIEYFFDQKKTDLFCMHPKITSKRQSSIFLPFYTKIKINDESSLFPLAFSTRILEFVTKFATHMNAQCARDICKINRDLQPHRRQLWQERERSSLLHILIQDEWQRTAI